MRLSHLTASAACGALLGLAASGLVRLHFADGRPSSATTAPSGVATVPDACADAVRRDTPVTERRGDPSEATPSPSSSRPAAKAHRPQPARARQPAHGGLSAELERGIRRLGERRYEIDRGALELALGNLGSLSRWIRVAPEIRAGRPVGFRIFAVAADGPFAKLGLRNDDVLVSINQLDLATPDQVLDAYSRLRTARRLMLGLVRGEETLAQEYTIR